MTVSTSYDTKVKGSSGILEMFIWLIIFTTLIYILYRMFHLKKQRLRNEETMFYQIYDNIKSTDPSAITKKENDIIKQKMIMKIHSDLLQLFDEKDLDKHT